MSDKGIIIPALRKRKQLLYEKYKYYEAPGPHTTEVVWRCAKGPCNAWVRTLREEYDERTTEIIAKGKCHQHKPLTSAEELKSLALAESLTLPRNFRLEKANKDPLMVEDLKTNLKDDYELIEISDDEIPPTVCCNPDSSDAKKSYEQNEVSEPSVNAIQKIAITPPISIADSSDSKTTHNEKSVGEPSENAKQIFQIPPSFPDSSPTKIIYEGNEVGGPSENKKFKITPSTSIPDSSDLKITSCTSIADASVTAPEKYGIPSVHRNIESPKVLDKRLTTMPYQAVPVLNLAQLVNKPKEPSVNAIQKIAITPLISIADSSDSKTTHKEESVGEPSENAKLIFQIPPSFPDSPPTKIIYEGNEVGGPSENKKFKITPSTSIPDSSDLKITSCTSIADASVTAPEKYGIPSVHRNIESPKVLDKRLTTMPYQAVPVLNLAQLVNKPKDEVSMFCELLRFKLRALDEDVREAAMHEINQLMFHVKTIQTHKR